MQQTKNIVFFDGVCSLCNAWVDRFIRLDKRKNLHFASLQGETAKSVLPSKDAEGLSSLFYSQKGLLFKESRAVLEIFADLGGAWKLLYVFRIVPPFIRDGLYKWVAKNRYKWFGKRETCRVPSASERGILLP